MCKILVLIIKRIILIPDFLNRFLTFRTGPRTHLFWLASLTWRQIKNFFVWLYFRLQALMTWWLWTLCTLHGPLLVRVATTGKVEIVNMNVDTVAKLISAVRWFDSANWTSDCYYPVFHNEFLSHQHHLTGNLIFIVSPLLNKSSNTNSDLTESANLILFCI